jgi:hypothetical protein
MDAYLDFMKDPCNKKSQEIKRTMDKTIVATKLNLERIRTMLEKKEDIDFRVVNSEIQRIMDKTTKT